MLIFGGIAGICSDQIWQLHFLRFFVYSLLTNQFNHKLLSFFK